MEGQLIDQWTRYRTNECMDGWAEKKEGTKVQLCSWLWACKVRTSKRDWVWLLVYLPFFICFKNAWRSISRHFISFLSCNSEHYPAFISQCGVSNINTCDCVLDKDSSEESALINTISAEGNHQVCVEEMQETSLGSWVIGALISP